MNSQDSPQPGYCAAAINHFGNQHSVLGAGGHTGPQPCPALPCPALPAKYAQKWECEWQYVAEYSWELCNLNVNDDGAAL